jgi:hypothetical protein
LAQHPEPHKLRLVRGRQFVQIAEATGQFLCRLLAHLLYAERGDEAGQGRARARLFDGVDEVLRALCAHTLEALQAFGVDPVRVEQIGRGFQHTGLSQPLDPPLPTPSMSSPALDTKWTMPSTTRAAQAWLGQ